MNVYEKRGIPTIINAAGTLTRLSGGIMRPEVAAAMADASAYTVDMATLQGHACETIAEITGAEAGYVTSGSAAGLLIGTAACMTGFNVAAMDRLPDTAGVKNEVIIPRSHRNSYDHAVRTTGARLVEVGLPDRASGAGVRDTEAWDIANAITERTAAVYYVATAESQPPLSEAVKVAHAAGVPVLVDAAAELPPQANLRRFIEEGADLVVFSGGKAIGGPQASGILCGRQHLVSAAALQHLDMDVFAELWEPPASLIDRTALSGVPRHGIGRPCKTGKEEIIGLLTALELFVAEGDAARHARWLTDVRAIADRLADLSAADVTITGDSDVTAVPKVSLRLTADDPTKAAADLQHQLLERGPPIHLDMVNYRSGVIVISPMCLKPGDAVTAADVITTLLRR
ncbi:aminotransferase class V-fold PLP-dependent enzyme [Bauldia sp.]|uniref:aminotransferase class V-fold PLP-dependent enzyme n=1 Tax=Bauldia sp. TaxID=2575872 RepID=UPI003BAC9D97